MTLAAPTPAVHARDGDKAYCLDLTHRAVRMNAQAGKWLDRFTRHDGVSVNCDDKRVEFSRFMAATPASMGDGWEDRQEREWNASQCSDAAFTAGDRKRLDGPRRLHDGSRQERLFRR